MKLYMIISACVTMLLTVSLPLLGASSYSDQDVEDLKKENKELRSELQKESKAAIEARNHAKALFQELMRYR